MNSMLREKLPIRLLYVEDEPAIRLPMLEMMSRWVDDIIVATDGFEGLEAFRQTGADIVITDLKMPRMNGLEMIAQLKKINPEVKAIIVSAHNDTEYFLDAINTGVDGFLLKPVMRAKLSETIERFGRSILSGRNARLHEEKFNALTGTVIDAIMIINDKGEISFWNNAAARIFGYSAEEVRAMPFQEIFEPAALPEGWPYSTKALVGFFNDLSRGKGILELNCVMKGGNPFPAEVSVSPLQVDNSWYAMLIIRDITERRQREKDLIEAREKAEAATLAKQKFLSVMTHEIRTPLHGILGTINLLAQEDPRPDQKDYFDTLEFSGNHLLSLINDILDFSKIEADRIHFENIEMNIRDIIDGMVKIFAYRALDKGIELSAQVDEALPVFVKGDPVRLNQILTNLIGNAVKFTEKGSIRILVKLTGQNHEKLDCLFEVVDTGIGIPKDKTKEIFDLFSQADADTTRKFGGTGLGLAITSKLIELQGGSIAVDSEPKKGSRFYFSLSFGLSDKPSGAIEEKTDELKSLKDVSILLVEDNRINQMIAMKFLKRWDASVDIASNGLEAVSMIQEKKYNIVLMDLQMPEMDGYQASYAIRRLNGDYYRSVPIIALTASTFNEVKAGIQKHGLNDIINKPFIPGDLNRKIHEYISGKQA